MKIQLAYDSDAFNVDMFSVYMSICRSMEAAALLHVNTIKNNNPCHFTHAVTEANEAIEKIKSFYLDTDKRRDGFELLTEKDLIKEAERFLNDDFY